MLTKADGVDADLVGQDTFLDHVADDFGMRFQAAIGVGSDVAEGVEAEFDLLVMGSLLHVLKVSASLSIDLQGSLADGGSLTGVRLAPPDCAQNITQ